MFVTCIELESMTTSVLLVACYCACTIKQLHANFNEIFSSKQMDIIIHEKKCQSKISQKIWSLCTRVNVYVVRGDVPHAWQWYVYMCIVARERWRSWTQSLYFLIAKYHNFCYKVAKSNQYQTIITFGIAFNIPRVTRFFRPMSHSLLFFSHFMMKIKIV